MSKDDAIEMIKVKDKDISKYLSACFYALGNDRDEVQIVARGNNIKRAVDVSAIMLRQYLDVSPEIPSMSEIMDALNEDNVSKAKKLLKQLMVCEIIIGSEKFDERNVSTIDIILRGKRKDADS